MIVRLGDAATDYANSQADSYMIGLANQPGTSAEINTPSPSMSTSDLLAWGAYAGAQQDDLTAGIKPASSYTVTPSGVVSNAGGSFANALSNLFGGSTNYARPANYTTSGSTIGGISTSTINMLLFGVVGVLVVMAISGGKKR
jgi:hypothetical protein